MLRQRAPNIYKRQIKTPHFCKDPKTNNFLFFFSSLLFFLSQRTKTREKGKAETQSETEISDRYFF